MTNDEQPSHQPKSLDDPNQLESPPIEANDDELQATSNERCMHSLLERMHESNDRRENRIQKTLAAFETDLTKIESQPLNTGRRWWYGAIVLAASLLLWAGISIYRPQDAHAAVDRILATATQPISRRYAVTIHQRGLLRPVTRRCVLTTLSTDRFVVRFPDSLIQPAATGSDGTSRWFVLGNRTRSSSDELELPADFFIDRVTARHMQVNSLLTQLPDCYSTRLLDEQPISESNNLACRPILATLTRLKSKLPSSITIWPHPQTGVVMRMTLNWNEKENPPIDKVELTLTETVDLPVSFYELEQQRKSSSQEAM